jgi:hypothetical protein
MRVLIDFSAGDFQRASQPQRPSPARVVERGLFRFVKTVWRFCFAPRKARAFLKMSGLHVRRAEEIFPRRFNFRFMTAHAEARGD